MILEKLIGVTIDTNLVKFDKIDKGNYELVLAKLAEHHYDLKKILRVKGTNKFTLHTYHYEESQLGESLHSFLSRKIRILVVSGDSDFSALAFERKYNGKSVAEVMESIDPENGEIIDDDEIYYEIKEFGVALTEDCVRLLSYIKDTFCDYDNLKTKNFYLENQIITR